MGTWIDLTSADGFTFPVYEAKPAGASMRGAVVVVQEIFGVNDHIRQVADGFAAQGYLALAPSMFHRLKAGVDLGYGTDDMTAGRELKAAAEALPAPGVMADLQATVDHAGAASGGKVGIVGYCWGGLVSWRAACVLNGLAFAAPYYGGGMTVGADAARQAKVPVLAHFGEQDHWIPLETVNAFAQAHPDVDVKVYAANHGFNCDQRGSWDAAAAALARERTLAFFAAHLHQK